MSDERTLHVAELFSLEGKVAIVTGAGRGLGAAMSVALSEMGADLFLVSRTERELSEVAESVRRNGRQAKFIVADVADIRNSNKIVDAALREFQKVDILINVAGTSHPCEAVSVTEEQWDATMDLNLKGTFFLTQAVGRHMIARRYGKIVNIASHLGIVGLPGRVVYGVSKAGVIHMTRVLALEWAPFHINVNCVAPCYTRTKLAWNVLGNDDFRSFVEQRTPLGGIAEPIDLCGAVVYLASEASRRMTGQTLLVDGGWCCQ